MFVRKKQNKSGSQSIQIISKNLGKYKVIRTVGCAKTKREEELLVLMVKTELERLQGSQTLFAEHDDLVIENFVNGIANDHIQIFGSELILGKIYRIIGFLEGGCPDLFSELFRKWSLNRPSGLTFFMVKINKFISYLIN